MDRRVILTFIGIYSIAAGFGFFLSGDSRVDATPVLDQTSSYILQGESTESVIEAVRSVDGEVTHELGIIDAVAATLTFPQRDQLLVNPAILSTGVNHWVNQE